MSTGKRATAGYFGDDGGHPTDGEWSGMGNYADVQEGGVVRPISPNVSAFKQGKAGLSCDTRRFLRDASE